MHEATLDYSRQTATILPVILWANDTFRADGWRFTFGGNTGLFRLIHGEGHGLTMLVAVSDFGTFWRVDDANGMAGEGQAP